MPFGRFSFILWDNFDANANLDMLEDIVIDRQQAPDLLVPPSLLKLSVVRMSQPEILRGSFRQSGLVSGRRLLAYFAS